MLLLVAVAIGDLTRVFSACVAWAAVGSSTTRCSSGSCSRSSPALVAASAAAAVVEGYCDDRHQLGPAHNQESTV